MNVAARAALLIRALNRLGITNMSILPKFFATSLRYDLTVPAEAQVRFEKYQPQKEAYAHPRLIAATIEQGSWTDDMTVQEMWAGLLASSCSSDGRDESNLIFISLLSQITGLQVRLLNYACKAVEKSVTSIGLIMPQRKNLRINVLELKHIAGIDDIHRLDRELDHLRGLELIDEGFDFVRSDVDITPTALALNLYVRCQGYIGSPVNFFQVEHFTKEP